jgi:hypothetical protein
VNQVRRGTRLPGQKNGKNLPISTEWCAVSQLGSVGGVRQAGGPAGGCATDVLNSLVRQSISVASEANCTYNCW